MALRRLLDLVFPPQCASCNALGSGLCAACAADSRTTSIRIAGLAVRAAGLYEGGLRAAVLALKDGRRDVADALGRTVAPLVAPGSLLVPVPTTARRRRVRGIDGVALVALRAAEIAGAGVVAALGRHSSEAQRGRSRTERLAARGRFACSAGSIAGRRCTLFDDVCTTGATLRDCAAAVGAAGGLVEDAVVVAVTKSERSWRRIVAG